MTHDNDDNDHHHHNYDDDMAMMTNNTNYPPVHLRATPTLKSPWEALLQVMCPIVLIF